MKFDWSDWVPRRMQQGEAYTPGEQRNTRDWVKLNTNEFPYPPTPAVEEAVVSAVKDLRYYPNPTGLLLRKALGEHHGVDAENVILFNGCDDALNCCIRGLVDSGEKVTMLNPSYSLYQTLLSNHGAESCYIDYNEGFDFPLDALVESDAKMFLLTSPNAPSGRGFKQEEFISLLEKKNAIFVLDETYADFADWTAIPLVGKYPNLIVVRSFSKTYGLAGLRIGYGIADSGALSALHQIRDVYNTDRLGQAGAIAAIEDVAYYKEKHAELNATKKDFMGFLEQKLGWSYFPSATNFVFCFPENRLNDVCPETAKSVYQFLVENKVLVRYFSNHKLIESGLRISIGTPSEMDMVKKLLQKWVNQE